MVKIGSTLESSRKDGKLANSDNIYDKRLGKMQEEINQKVSSLSPVDEEDLTKTFGEDGHSVTKFADRSYSPQNFSGKGYKILRKNIKPVSLAVTKIVVSSVPTSDGYLAFIINGVESHVDVVASSDTTTDKVAEKIAAKLSETMTEYEVSKDASTITLTRKCGSTVSASSFSANSTGVLCTITDGTKKELRNILTSDMINQSNIIYEIRYNFDLDCETLNVPEGCTLKFEGGMLRNGKVVYNNTYLKSQNTNIYRDVLVLGTVRNDIAYSDWFCARKDGISDDSTALQNFFNCGAKKFIVTKGTYKINKGLSLPAFSDIDFSFSILNPSSGVTCLGYYGINTENYNIDTVLKNFIIDSKGLPDIIGLQLGPGVYFNYVYNFDIRVYGERNIGIVETQNFNTILRDGRIIGKIEGYLPETVGIKFTTGNVGGYNGQVTNLKTDSILIQGFDYGCLFDYDNSTAHDTIMFTNIGFSVCNIGYYLKSGYTSVLVENQRIEFSNLLAKVDFCRTLTLKDLYLIDTGVIEIISGMACMLGSVYCLNIDSSKKRRGYSVKNTARLAFDVSCYDDIGFKIKDEIAEGVLTRFGKKYSSIGDALNNLWSTSFVENIPTIKKSSTETHKLALNISANDYWINDTNTILSVWSSTDCIKLGTNIYGMEGGIDGDKHLLTSDSDTYRDVMLDDHYFRINNKNFILLEKVNGVWKVIGHNAVSYGSTESFGVTDYYGLIINKVGKYVDAFGRTGNVAIKGSDMDRPKTLTADDAGKEFFQDNINCPIWWNGSKWINALGFAPSRTKGTTALRPGFNVGEDEGFEYYDTTLKKKILWNGTAWVNIDGTALS